VPGLLIVGFREGTPAAVQSAVHAGLGAEVVRKLARGRMDLVRIDEPDALADRYAGYEAHPSVAFVQPDYYGEGGFTPDDSQWAFLWHHRNTGQFGGTPGADLESEAGWDHTRGSSSVVVAVLDSGIDSDHPEFAGRILPGWDFVNDDADPEDDHSHGTYATGLLAANANNAFSVAGVDHFCMILPVKVLRDDGFGSTSDLLDGIDWASANGADVISMSLINYPGGFGSALDITLKNAKLAGAINVACAGNGGIGDADVSWPGASNHSISIGATTNTDERAWYSGTGQKLEFVAPADNIVTVRYDTSADGYSFFGGCSAATPVTAGIVSILRGLNPDLRTRQIRLILAAGAEDQVGPPGEDTPGWDEYFGHGRVNLRATLQAFLAATSAPDRRVAATTSLEVEARPNPTRGGTVVRYALPAMSWVTMTVYDVSGRRVRRIVDGIRTGGPQEASWDGRDDRGRAAAPGLYFVRTRVDDRVETVKITLVR
jgi:subtilisin family serine protease